MHYLSSVYFISQPLHVSGISVAHHQELYCVYVKLKDRKRSLSGKKDHNALWHYRNGHNAKFCVVEVIVKTVRVSDWKSLATSEREGELT